MLPTEAKKFAVLTFRICDGGRAAHQQLQPNEAISLNIDAFDDGQ